MHKLKWPFLLSLCVLAPYLPGCAKQDPPPPSAPAVTVSKPVVRTVTEYFEYSGNTAAVNQVEVVARVPGVLIDQKYELLNDVGRVTQVEKDALLFEIEHEPYQIAVDAADAEVKRVEALVAAAQATYDAQKRAFDRGGAAEQDLILADASLKQREAELLAAKAKLAQAELDLSYTYIKSPIAGEVSRNLVDTGTYVGGGGQTVLTRVTQMSPIYVYFDVSESIVQQYLARYTAGDPDAAITPPSLELATAADDKGVYSHTGVVDWWDRSVDRGTGTVVVRGVLDNADGSLVPGLFARIRVPFEQITGAVLVREDAIGTDLSGKYVLIVVKNEQGMDIVQKQPITLKMRTDDGLRVVEGLSPDATYITAGIQKVRPGMPVKAELAAIPSPGETPATPDEPAPAEQAPSDTPPAAVPSTEGDA